MIPRVGADASILPGCGKASGASAASHSASPGVRRLAGARTSEPDTARPRGVAGAVLRLPEHDFGLEGAERLVAHPPPPPPPPPLNPTHPPPPPPPTHPSR